MASSAFSQHSEPVTLGVSNTLLANVKKKGKSWKDARTELCPLKFLQVLVRAEQALHRLDVLLLREPRKVVQVVERRVEHSGTGIPPIC